MISACYIFIVLFISVLFEVMVGSAGAMLPLSGMSVFYFGIVYGWKTGACLGFISGLAIDMLYGRGFPVSALSLTLVAGIVVFWLLKGETKDFLLHVIPGVMISALTSLLVIVIYWNGFLLCGAWHLSFQIVFSMISGAILLPLIILFLDLISELLGMELYRNARENIEELI